jgi:hypothetical protein
MPLTIRKTGDTPGQFAYWHFSDLASVTSDVRSQGQSRHDLEAPAIPLMTQPVWKRFSSPKNCTQPGAMSLDATV